MHELMSDPVMLPSSKVILDRKTVLRHLVKSNCDPFDRQILKENDLIELPDLKLEIEEFVKNLL